MRPTIRVGDILTLKKPHPCGCNRWEVLRVGADFRLRCLGCRRLVMLPRRRVESRIRHVESTSDTSGPGGTGSCSWE
ncbi:MAG: DUF951 domain-containing protein [Bacillota bacterium]